VRITTRIDEADPFQSVYSTIHELGHALYEQGLRPEDGHTPAGGAASMGVHESQSRLWENQIGRGRAFAEWLYAEMRAAFGDIGLDGPEALWRAANRVETGFIRTDADEVHYNLHVLMRFELERALIAGDLDVADLEGEWNARFAADFGRDVPHAGVGVLQDVHWPVGLFGYFPTYTLGNVYAAALDARLRADVPDLDASLAAGDGAPALAWLRDKVHRRGREVPPDRIVAEAAGRPADPATLVAALEAKYGALYGVG
jgi:carboxypeptidase Taq